MALSMSHTRELCGQRRYHVTNALQQEPALKHHSSQLAIFPAFDSFFERHDLQLQGDQVTAPFSSSRGVFFGKKLELISTQERARA